LGGNCAFDDFCINVDFFGIVDDVSVDVVDVGFDVLDWLNSLLSLLVLGLELGLKLVNELEDFSEAEVDEIEDVEVEIDEVGGAESESIVSNSDLS